MGLIHYRSDIQGLRAVAVLAVMLFHFNPSLLPAGFVGVDVFLVISGFLITSILLHKKAQSSYTLKGTLKYFYSSRFKRVAPAYFTMLILVSFASAVFFLPQDLATYQHGLKKAFWFNSNNYFAGFGDYFAPANHEQPLLHTWSLAVEIQFYLLAPFLILLLPSKTLKWTLGTIIVGFIALAEYRLRIDGTQQATYYSLYARLPEFLAGGLVALFHAHKPQMSDAMGGVLASFGLALILIAAIFQPKLGHFPGFLVLLPAAGAIFVLLQPARGLAQQILSSRSMVWVGELSYSLYLWHWPVLALLRYYTGEQELDMPFGLLFISLTLVLATVSFYGIEAPLRMPRTCSKQVLSYALLATLVLGTSKSIAKVNRAFSPLPLPIQYQRYADPATICHGQIVGDCLKGDLRSSKEVLVLGDSHAAMLNLFFDQVGKEQGFRARIISASSCVTIPGFDYQRIPESARHSCLSQIEYARRFLPSATTIIISSLWDWHLESISFQVALKKFLKEQTASGKRIYIMEQVPRLTRNPMRNLRFKSIGLNSKISLSEKFINANKLLEREAQNIPLVTCLNFEWTGLFLNIPFYQGELFYMDEHHLNELGSLFYAQAATGEFKKLISNQNK